MNIRKTSFIITILLSLGAATIEAAVEREKLAGLMNTLKTYEYNKIKDEDLRWIELQVGAASSDESVRAQVELKLIDALAGAATNDARQFICRQLRTVGTAKCIGQLEALLTDPKLSHMARYALERIDVPDARQALHRNLAKTAGKLKAGIINALAKASYVKAKTDILKLLSDSNEDIALAAIKAAGHYGGGDAVKILREARPAASKDRQIEIDEALLVCAENYVAVGQMSQASEIYQEFYSGNFPGQFRAAGLRGLALTQSDRIADLLTQSIHGDNADLRRNAIGMMAQIKGKKTTDAFLKLARSLPADGQELIIRALAARGDLSAAPTIINTVSSPHENVRLAALEALGAVGTPQSIAPLAQAASTSGGHEQQLARSSLVRIEGKGIDEAFIRAINANDAGSRVEVIRAIGLRNSQTPFSALLKVARNDAQSAVRREAILSMGKIGDSSDLNALLELALSPKQLGDHSSIESAVAAIFNKIENVDAQAAPVIAALKRAPDEAKGVLLSLLTRPATPSALQAVQAAVNATNSKVSDAGIRALGQWPNAAPADQLFLIASENSNKIHAVLALRGYIRMALSTESPTESFVKALGIASRNDDIKAILSGLGKTDTLEALEIADKYMAKDDFKAEAQRAAVRIAGKYCWSDGNRAKETLEKVISQTRDKGIGNEARKVLSNMEKLKDNIFVWKGVGPYRIKGINNGQKVFARRFEPELNSDDKALKWKNVRIALDRNNRIDLEATFGKIDYCCAYLTTTVISTRDQQARVHWGADDYITGWINGKSVGNGLVTLRKGANVLMLKVGDHGGGWNFSCRLTKPDDSALDGLKFQQN